MTGESHWDIPLILKCAPPYRTDKAAQGSATTVQAVFRSALARRRTAALVPKVYRKDFDPDTGDFYYTNTRTKEVRWDDPAKALSLIDADRAAPQRDAASGKASAGGLRYEHTPPLTQARRGLAAHGL